MNDEIKSALKIISDRQCEDRKLIDQIMLSILIEKGQVFANHYKCREDPSNLSHNIVDIIINGTPISACLTCGYITDSGGEQVHIDDVIKRSN